MNVLAKSLRWLFFQYYWHKTPSSDCRLLEAISSGSLFFTALDPERIIVSFFSLDTIEVGDYHQLPIHSVGKLIYVFIYVLIYLFVQIHLCLPELPVQASLRPWLFLQRCEGELLYFLLNKDWWHFERFRIPRDYSLHEAGWRRSLCRVGAGLAHQLSFVHSPLLSIP